MKKVLLILLLPLLMLALVSAQDCDIKSKNTVDFLNEIPDLNARLSGCDTAIPSPMNMLFGSDVINFQIVRNDGSKSTFMIITEDDKLKSIEIGSSDKPNYVATVAECAFDNALASGNLGGALAYLYNKKHLTLSPRGFWKTIAFKVAMLFARGSLKSMEQEIELTCPKKEVGEVCNHGGECKTGNCIYYGGEGPDRTYKCSCHPLKLVIEQGCPDIPQYPETGKGKAGDICQHGGQCESGNCIGIIPGQLYKCSCDPFRFVEGDC